MEQISVSRQEFTGTNAERTALQKTTLNARDTWIESDTGDEFVFDGNGSLGSWVQTSTGGANNAYETGEFAHERNAGTVNQYGVGVPESEYAIVTADTDVSSSSPALLFGVTVVVVTATNVIEIRDSTSAGAGTVVLSIPAATAVGTYFPCNGILMDTGLYADFTGTGTLRLDWRLQ